jgi:hypothetical protein
MEKYFILPIDLDEETDKPVSLNKDEIKEVITEYCSDGDMVVIDMVPYILAPTPERFSEMVDLSEELCADDSLKNIEIHVSLNGIDYNKLIKDYGYEFLCTDRVRDDLCLDKRDVMFIDDIISAVREQKDKE